MYKDTLDFSFLNSTNLTSSSQPQQSTHETISVSPSPKNQMYQPPLLGTFPKGPGECLLVVKDADAMALCSAQPTAGISTDIA